MRIIGYHVIFVYTVPRSLTARALTRWYRRKLAGWSRQSHFFRHGAALIDVGTSYYEQRYWIDVDPDHAPRYP